MSKVLSPRQIDPAVLSLYEAPGTLSMLEDSYKPTQYQPCPLLPDSLLSYQGIGNVSLSYLKYNLPLLILKIFFFCLTFIIEDPLYL